MKFTFRLKRMNKIEEAGYSKTTRTQPTQLIEVVNESGNIVTKIIFFRWGKLLNAHDRENCNRGWWRDVLFSGIDDCWRNMTLSSIDNRIAKSDLLSSVQGLLTEEQYLLDTSRRLESAHFYLTDCYNIHCGFPGLDIYFGVIKTPVKR